MILIGLLCLWALPQDIFAQSLDKEKKYVEKFMKAIVILDDMGHHSLAFSLTQKLREDKAYIQVNAILEQNAIVLKCHAIFQRGKNAYVVAKPKDDSFFHYKDAMYLIWLLSLLHGELDEPILAKNLNQILLPHWKGKLVQEVEKEHKKMHDWYQNLNQKQGLTFKKIWPEQENTFAQRILEDEAGNFVLLGTFDNPESGKKDIFLAKISPQGNKIWLKKFGGPNKDVAAGLWKTSDKGYLILGNTWSFGEGKQDVWLVKTDENGDKIWDKAYGGSRTEEGFWVHETREGNFLVAASSDSFGSIHQDMWLFQVAKDGEKLWDRVLDGPCTNKSAMVVGLPGSELVIAGNWVDDQDENIALTKVDKEGKKIWEKTYGGKKPDNVVALFALEPEGFILGGATSSFGDGWGNVWIMKLSATGEKVWDKTISEKAQEKASPTCMQKVGESLFLCGYATTFGVEQNSSWLMKISLEGKLLWKKDLGTGIAQWLIPTKDGGLLIIGEEVEKDKNCIFLLKVDSEGRF